MRSWAWLFERGATFDRDVAAVTAALADRRADAAGDEDTVAETDAEGEEP
jgi:hypothetical protein